MVTEGFVEEYTKATVTGESEPDVREQFDKSALPDSFEKPILDLLIAKDIAQ